MQGFKAVPLAELRASLLKIARQVRLKGARIAATHYGQEVGYLVPMKEVASLDISEGRGDDVALTVFRAHITEHWERLQFDIDCVYLTYHSRRVAAFLSPRLVERLASAQSS